MYPSYLRLFEKNYRSLELYTQIQAFGERKFLGVGFGFDRRTGVQRDLVTSACGARRTSARMRQCDRGPVSASGARRLRRGRDQLRSGARPATSGRFSTQIEVFGFEWKLNSIVLHIQSFGPLLSGEPGAVLCSQRSFRAILRTSSINCSNSCPSAARSAAIYLAR